MVWAAPGSNRCVPNDYRLARPMAARLMGVLLALLGLIVLLTTVAVGLLDLPTLLLAAVGVGVLLAVVAGGLLLTRRATVVSLTDVGYRVRLVRGAGVMAARWTDVEDVVTATASGEKVVVLRLRDGGTTTIPVRMLDSDPDAFVQDLQQHLNTGHGYRRIR